jgi:hypothetical protein
MMPRIRDTDLIGEEEDVMESRIASACSAGGDSTVSAGRQREARIAVVFIYKHGLLVRFRTAL